MNKNLFRGALLEAILLSLIKESSSQGLHGYALLMAVKKKFDVRIGPSTLYPELKMLERRGLIASRWDFTMSKARCLYCITNKGQNLLQEYSVQLKIVVPALANRTLPWITVKVAAIMVVLGNLSSSLNLHNHRFPSFPPVNLQLNSFLSVTGFFTAIWFAAST